MDDEPEVDGARGAALSDDIRDIFGILRELAGFLYLLTLIIVALVLFVFFKGIAISLEILVRLADPFGWEDEVHAGNVIRRRLPAENSSSDAGQAMRD